jgi:hypothetical protein
MDTQTNIPTNSKKFLDVVNMSHFSNVMVFLSFLIPFIMVISILSLSFIFQNFKSLIFLAFLVAASGFRELLYSQYQNFFKMYENDGTLCTAIRFSKYSNKSFSFFTTFFTFIYVCMPMFVYNTINWLVVVGFLFVVVIDFSIKIIKCVSKEDYTELFVDSLYGTCIASIIILGMTSSTASSKFLFFNEVNSNKQMCSMPKNQTFKCSVYKNGEIIGSI